jgi:hypothetical protein
VFDKIILSCWLLFVHQTHDRILSILSISYLISIKFAIISYLYHILTIKRALKGDHLLGILTLFVFHLNIVLRYVLFWHQSIFVLGSPEEAREKYQVKCSRNERETPHRHPNLTISIHSLCET